MKKIFSSILFIIVCHIASAQSDSSFFTVRLSSFNVNVSNNLATLYWKTVCYLQYANFQIQKSEDGKDFKTIHSFTADKYRCQQPFDYTDSSGGIKGNVYYRINVGSIDGPFYHSIIRHLFLKGAGFDLNAVYPTMVAGIINFSISNSENGAFRAVIYNQNGLVVKSKVLQADKGVTPFIMKAEGLSPGYYWLQVANDKGDLKSVKFFKQ